jgi:hypothetical protein
MSGDKAYTFSRTPAARRVVVPPLKLVRVLNRQRPARLRIPERVIRPHCTVQPWGIPLALYADDTEPMCGTGTLASAACDSNPLIQVASRPAWADAGFHR